MSNLTFNQQSEIQSITAEALEVIEAHPVAHRHLQTVVESIGYLAYCAVKDSNDARLAEIQRLIDVAKADRSVELLKINRSIQAEMQQLRSEMRQGLSAIARQNNHLYSALDERLSIVENQALVPPKPQVIYVREQPVNYYVDNSYTNNSQRNHNDGVGIEAIAWACVAIFFTILICSILPILPYGRR